MYRLLQNADKSLYFRFLEMHTRDSLAGSLRSVTDYCQPYERRFYIYRH